MRCSARFLLGPLLLWGLLEAAHDAGWNGHQVYRPHHPSLPGFRYSRSQNYANLIMADVINRLGVKLLAIQNEYNENNIAISPYGALSVLIALGEGLQGDAVREIQLALHLPNDISIIRQGLRDINRHLQSYFIPKEGFLAGLTLNYDSVSLKPQYQDILLYYGYDLTAFNVALYPPPPRMPPAKSASVPTSTTTSSTTAAPVMSITSTENIPPTSPTVQVDTNTTPKPIESTTTNIVDPMTSTTTTTGADELSTAIPTTTQTVTSPTTIMTSSGEPIITVISTISSLASVVTSIPNTNINTSNTTRTPKTTANVSLTHNTINILSPYFAPFELTIQNLSDPPTGANLTKVSTEIASRSSEPNRTITPTTDSSSLSSETTQSATEEITDYGTTESPAISTSTIETTKFQTVLKAAEVTEQQTVTTEAATAVTTEQQIQTNEAVTAGTTKKQILTTEAVTAGDTILTTEAITADTTEQQILTTEAIIADTTEQQILTTEAVTAGPTEQKILTTEAITADITEQQILTTEAITADTTEQQILTTEAIIADTTEQQILTTEAIIVDTTEQQILTTEAVTAGPTEQQILTTEAITADTTEQQILTTEAIIADTTKQQILSTEAIIVDTTKQEILTTESMAAGITKQQILTTEATAAVTTVQQILTTEAMAAVTTEQQILTTEAGAEITTKAEADETTMTTTEFVTTSVGFAGSPKQKRMSTQSSISLNELTWTDNYNNPRRRVAKSVSEYVDYQKHFEDTMYSYPKPIDPPMFQEPLYFLTQGRYKDYSVNFMRYNTLLPVCDVVHLDARALKFPLDRKEYYLLILLPNKYNGVDKLVRDLRNIGDFRHIIDCLRTIHVDVTIPSFKMNGYVKLTNLFQRMGIKKVFEPNQGDFTPMTDQNQIYVTNIEQAITVDIKHYVDIENMSQKSSYPWEFKADHPFLFFVLDSELQVALMSGKITNPLNTRIS